MNGNNTTKTRNTCKHRLSIHEWATREYTHHYRKPPEYSASPASISEECGRPTYDGDDEYCVFHSRLPDKEEDFINALCDRFIEENEENEKKFDFRGFVFPEFFSFKALLVQLSIQQEKFIEREEFIFEDANFYGAEFFCDADFQGFQFNGNGDGTCFIEAKFHKYADFTKAKFTGSGQATFFFACFFSGASFYWAEFHLHQGKGFAKDWINFEWTTFIGDIGKIENQKITERDIRLNRVNFSNTLFKGESKLSFGNSFFSLLGGIDFKGATFEEKIAIEFKDTVFDNGTIIDFRNVELLDLKRRITFDNVDMSLCLFAGTYLRHIDAREIRWNKWAREIRWNKWQWRPFFYGNRNKIFDEILCFKSRNKVLDKIVRILHDRSYMKILDTISDIRMRVENDSYGDLNEKEVKIEEEIIKEIKRKHELKDNSSKDQRKDERYRKIILSVSEKAERKYLMRLFFNVRTEEKGRIYENLKRIREIDEDVVKEFIKKILDRIQPEGSEPIQNQAYKTKQLYTQLSLKYETTGRYHEAGDFFIGEMEMRRKDEENENCFNKVILWLYKKISLYGERPARVLIYIFIPMILFTFPYFFWGLKTDNCDTENVINYACKFSTPTKEFWTDLGNTLLYSISNFTLGRTFTDLIPANFFTACITIFENLVGIAIITLFVLSMNRKFRRIKDR
ncbi:MAG: hypothetical protein JW885_16900 [Deltaproteobacteria bacterium]|nr:hypothetical protein [Candidatus Zymogenaceae bacterium]